jgi:dTDP-4-amino-4,6-dideoxygalactose transaminase
VVRTKKRDKLQKFLTKEGIGCGIHYPVPVNLIPAFRGLGYKKGDFPEAEAQSREVLSLPLFPELSDAEAERVVAAVKRFFRN